MKGVFVVIVVALTAYRKSLFGMRLRTAGENEDKGDYRELNSSTMAWIHSIRGFLMPVASLQEI